MKKTKKRTERFDPFAEKIKKRSREKPKSEFVSVLGVFPIDSIVLN